MEQIRFSIPSHFSEEYLDGLADLVSRIPRGREAIHNAYGSRPTTSMGHARAPGSIRSVTDAELTAYVERLHDLGIRFHYTMNAPWSAAMERTADGRAAIREEVERLIDMGIDAFIIGNPYLLRLLRDWFPSVGLVGSINLRARNGEAVAKIVGLGADHVVLERDVNRDFPLIRKLAPRWNDRISLLANSTCLVECPFQTYHALETALLSASTPKNADAGSQGAKPQDPNACFQYCLDQLLNEPAEMLCATWILPEDTQLYGDAGIRQIKIQGRSLPAQEQLKLVEAYLTRKTPGGEVLRLFPGLMAALESRACERSLPDSAISPFRLLTIERLNAVGFVDSFANGARNCRVGCESCHYCHSVLDRLVSDTGSV